MKLRTVIHSTCTDCIPRNKAWVRIPWPWPLWCGSHCWETDRGRARAFWSDWFSLPGMVPPHAQWAAFWPPLEQNVQQWNTPGCERCLFLTVTVNGEPFSVQTKSKEQPRESTGVCWASHRLNSLSHRPCPWRDEDSRQKQWRGSVASWVLSWTGPDTNAVRGVKESVLPPWHADGGHTDGVRHSVVSDCLRPYGLQPAKLLCPWILQARILERTAVPSSRDSPDQELNLGLLHYRQILYHLGHQVSTSKLNCAFKSLTLVSISSIPEQFKNIYDPFSNFSATHSHPSDPKPIHFFSSLHPGHNCLPIHSF